MKIKKGDNIIVITGKDKGKSGSVEKVITKKDLVLVMGVNVIKKHQKSRKGAGKGQIVEKSMPIHISNVAISAGGKKSRVGFEVKGDKKVRVAKKSGKTI
jgi:large subunit ribosomal protein L24